MKRAVIVLFGIFIVLNSYSQTNLAHSEVSINKYFVDADVYSQIDFYYSNNSDGTYVLWIEKNNVDSLSNFKKIRKHFNTVKGDFSLMQLLWDGNIGSYTPSLFDSFMKIIKPKEKFLVSIIKKGEIMENSDLVKTISNRIIAVNVNEIKGLQINPTIDMFNYNARSVTILAEWLE